MQHLRFDRSAPLSAQPGTGHNRWHPQIEPLLRIEPGETVRLDLRDGLDGQIGPDTDAASFVPAPGVAHPLSGPIAVAGAEPGDVLEVEVLAIEPDSYGFTMVMPDICLLRDRALAPYLVHWRIEDGLARSEQLPGVAIAGDPFLGCMGAAPSLRQLAAIAARERALEDEIGVELPGPIATAAIPSGAPAANEGLHTIPPRENGGNLDVRHCRVGARVMFPVQVAGGLLSVGDAHFAQGDGEVAATAIEMRASATLRIHLRPAAQVEWPIAAVAIEGPAPRRPDGPVFSTTGISVSPEGVNRMLAVRTAAANALGQLVDWLVATRGWRAEQALALASVAADLRIASIVNAPNAVVCAMLPLEVFERG